MLWTKHGFPKIGWSPKNSVSLFSTVCSVTSAAASASWNRSGALRGVASLERIGIITNFTPLPTKTIRIDRRIGRADIDVMPVQRFGAERACRLKHRNGALGIYCRDWLGSVLDVVLVARLPFMGCGEAECSIGVLTTSTETRPPFSTVESLPEHGEHPRDVQVREQNLSVAWDNLFPVRKSFTVSVCSVTFPFASVVRCTTDGFTLPVEGSRSAGASALGCCCIRHDKHRAVGGDKILAGIENEIEDGVRFVLGDKP